MALLTLGGLELDGFEVPASIRFGGQQSAVVHKLLGGGRIIDTMGRDDSALRWRGVLAGAGAGDRARTLDAVRVAGSVLPLAWDEFCYAVVVARLDLEYCSPWWILYRIECLVLSDLAQSPITALLDIAGSVLGDLGSASAYVNVSGLLASLSAPSALDPGSSAVAPALVGLGGVQATLTASIGSAEQGLDSGDLTSLVSASGTLAQLTTAQGYLGRTANNLEGVIA